MVITRFADNNKPKLFLYSISILIFAVLLFPNLVSADLGPKPSTTIFLTYDKEVISDNVFYAAMLVCIKADNEFQFVNKDLDSHLNIKEYNPEEDCYWQPSYLSWGGDCRKSKCEFSYMLPDRFKLAVYVPSRDNVYISDEVLRENFNSTYEANISPNGVIEIKETTSFLKSDQSKTIKSFLLALFLTLALELIVAKIYISVKKISRRLLRSVLIVNFISLAIVWSVFPILKTEILIVMAAEIFAVIFETGFIYLLNRKELNLGKAIFLSFIMNMTSFFVGGFILLFILNFIPYF